MHQNTMMTCKNVSEVAQLWKNMERASDKSKKGFNRWDFSTSVWCDREGGVLTIEQTHNHIITVFGNSTEITGAPKDVLWHAAHHQWLDPNQTGSVFPDEYPSSALRAERNFCLGALLKCSFLYRNGYKWNAALVTPSYSL